MLSFGIAPNMIAGTNKQCKTTQCASVCQGKCCAYDCSPADSSVSAFVTATKSLHIMPLSPQYDFPQDVAQFTQEEQQTYRQAFVKNQSCALGKPVGWKLALGAASPTNPLLGYTQPVVGQLLSQMLIKGPQARINPNYAVLPIYEVDVFVRVKSAAINHAKTPRELIESLDLVFPAYELAAGYVPTLSDLFGPQRGGPGLLPLLNGAARLAVLGCPIKIPGKRSIEEWVTTLSSLTGTEEITTESETFTRSFNTTTNFVTFALTLVQKVQELGYTLKKGDILSLGNLTGTNLWQASIQEVKATYTNLSPDGQPVTVTVYFDPQGECTSSAS